MKMTGVNHDIITIKFPQILKYVYINPEVLHALAMHKILTLKIKCDRISENGFKSHMKSSVFRHIFNYIATNAYVFLEYLLHNFNNLSIKFHAM